MVEQRREGDEVIVLCKLTIDEPQITKTQFGQARIGDAGAAIRGRAGGISFTARPNGPDAPAAGGDTEAAAYRAATEAALAKCAAML